MTLDQWITGFAGASMMEWVATISGFICVFLIIRRSIWCFFFGLIQVSLYSFIFFEVKLYSDMLLHLIYVGFQFYGFMLWREDLDNQNRVNIRRGSSQSYGVAIITVLCSTALLGFVMATQTDASLPYYDAFTTCASLMAQWLMSHKRLYNWTVWIIVDIVAIWIYLQKGLYPTSVLYLCFLIMACFGQWQWYRDYTRSQTAVPYRPS